MINKSAVAGKSEKTSGEGQGAARHAKVMTGPHAPLVQLVVLLPLVIIYEMAVPFTTLKSGWYHAIDAWSQRLLGRIGLTEYYLPGALILATLLVVHLVRRDPWRIEPRQFWRVWGEALVWTVPLVGMYLVFTLPVRKLLGIGGFLQLPARGPEGLFSSIVLYIGAGLFEEFVFRLVMISIVLFVLQRAFKVGVSAAQVVAVCVAAAVFSAAHHFGPGAPAYHPVDFLFRVAAGIYLGATYISRGFATAAIVHAMFNIVLAFWAVW